MRRRACSGKERRMSRTFCRRWPIMMWMGLIALSMGCGTLGTSSPPYDPRPNRPCFQWLVAKDQDVYIYDNGSLIARLEAEPYDAVISGWCLLKYNQDLTNEIRRLAH